MFTADTDGRNLFVADPNGGTSHFVWRDPKHIAAWAWHPSRGERFYLFEDRTENIVVIGPDAMTVNGHNTYLPGHNNAWILNDTYPDKQRLQHVYLYHVPTGRRVPVVDFPSPIAYAHNEWRCDTHPSASRDGRLVSFDSPHDGGRQVYVADLGTLLT
jgi:Tol biopolymer transport system component